MQLSLKLDDRPDLHSTPFLTVPKCGTFGPAEEISSNPGVYLTFLHGSPGVHFGATYLAGCTPRELRCSMKKDSYLNVMGFMFNAAGMLRGGHWQQSSEGGFRFYTVSYVEYSPGGLVSKAMYRCALSEGDEVFAFQYDRQGRLISQAGRRPAGCFEGEKFAHAFETIKYFEYNNKKFPHLPSKAIIRMYKPSRVELYYDIVYETDTKGRIMRIREIYGDGGEAIKGCSYDQAGKISKLSIFSRDGRKETYNYTYDTEGRLLSITQAGSNRKWELTYDAAGQIEKLVAPAPYYDPRRHPVENMDFLPVY